MHYGYAHIMAALLLSSHPTYFVSYMVRNISHWIHELTLNRAQDMLSSLPSKRCYKAIPDHTCIRQISMWPLNPVLCVHLHWGNTKYGLYILAVVMNGLEEQEACFHCIPSNQDTVLSMFECWPATAMPLIRRIQCMVDCFAKKQ